MCPGFMFVPRKPRPVGNEYHTIADRLCGILFYMEIFDGKDRPKGRRKDKYHEYGNTGILLIGLCIHLFMNGNIVIVYSGIVCYLL